MNTLKINHETLLNREFDFKAALTRAAVDGYSFSSDVLTTEACDVLEDEAARLRFETGDYVTKPISEYKTTKVTQSHERAYLSIGNWQIPVATAVSAALVRKVNKVVSQLPALDDPLRSLGYWTPTEAGYQRYRTTSDHISPHRDRRTDQLLGATVTVGGSALVRIHRTLDDPNDYSKLEVLDEFEAKSGGLMLLRASGFNGGELVIHEVLPPTEGGRLVLNLRMRPDVLKTPSEEASHEQH